MKKTGNGSSHFKFTLSKRMSIGCAMIYRILGITFFLGLNFFAQATLAKIDVTASVNTKHVGLGQQLQLTISVTAENEAASPNDPRLPGLDGFALRGKSEGTSVRHEMVNGQILNRVTIQHHYILEPERDGKLQIGAAEVVVGKDVYKTTPISVEVSRKPVAQNNAQQMPKGDDTEDEVDAMFSQLLKRRGLIPSLPGSGSGLGGGGNAPNAIDVKPPEGDEAFFVRAEVDKTSAYVGEQITVNFYVYTRHQIQNFDSLKYPDLKNFWKEDLEISTSFRFEDVIVKGIVYRRALLASYALFPIKEGNLKIDSYKTRGTVVMSNNGFGAFGFGQPYQYSKASPEIKIQALALPQKSMPKDFSGAVGDFEIRAEVPSQKIAVGQPFSLKIRIEGRGNAKSVELPPLGLPSSVEVYDTKNETKFFRDGQSFKEFEVLLIPRAEGALQIPSIPLSYFNPATRSYSSKSTQPISLQVGSGGGLANTNSNTTQQPSGATKPKVQALELPTLSIENESASQFSDKFGWMGLGFFHLAIVLGLLFAANRQMGWNAARDKQRKEFRARVKKVETAVSSKSYQEAALQTLNLMSWFLGQLGNQDLTGLSFDRVSQVLPIKIQKELGKQLQNLYDQLKVIAYAAADERKNLDQKTMKALVTEMVSCLEKSKKIWDE